jgi:hypothetical protein
MTGTWKKERPMNIEIALNLGKSKAIGILGTYKALSGALRRTDSFCESRLLLDARFQ